MGLYFESSLRERVDLDSENIFSIESLFSSLESSERFSPFRAFLSESLGDSKVYDPTIIRQNNEFN